MGRSNISRKFTPSFSSDDTRRKLMLGVAAACAFTASASLVQASGSLAIGEGDLQAMYWAALDASFEPGRGGPFDYLADNRFDVVVSEALGDLGKAFGTAWSYASAGTGLSDGGGLAEFTKPDAIGLFLNDAAAAIRTYSGIPEYVTKGAAAGASLIAGGMMLQKIGTTFNSWFRPSTEEYLEKRIALLDDAKRLDKDIAETRERAIIAIAKLETWNRDPLATTVSPDEVSIAQRRFSGKGFSDIIREIRTLARQSEIVQSDRVRSGGVAADAPLETRDIVREVVMDEMPSVVNPFTLEDPQPTPHPAPPSPPQADPAPSGGAPDPSVS